MNASSKKLEDGSASELWKHITHVNKIMEKIVFFYRIVISLRLLTFPNWELILILAPLLGSEQRSLGPAKTFSSVEHSCITLVVHRHFRCNSTVGIFTTGVNKGPAASDNHISGHLTDMFVLQLSLNREFSFVSLKMEGSSENDCYCPEVLAVRRRVDYAALIRRHNNVGSECYCPEGLADRRKVDYAILMGSDDKIVTCIRAFCFGTLTKVNTHFVVLLETIKTRNTVKTVFETFWTHHQLNVIVLVVNQRGGVDIFKWFPLDESPRVMMVDQCDGRVFK